MNSEPTAATVTHNFLPEYYDSTNPLPINHNYLPHQFYQPDVILARIKALVARGDFTLGRAVNEFEDAIRTMVGTKYCIGVGSGTDALRLSLVACGVGPGDEVITTPYTFFATVGAIVTVGASPVFVDIDDDFNINPSLLQRAITQNTKAIIPVHWSGLICEMDAITRIAEQHGLHVIEDACHALQATYHGRTAGSLGTTGCFSLHPLKNLNVWGDGGFITTNSDTLHEKLVLLRNHGLINRNECAVFAFNSRLDTLQAIVAIELLKRIDHITASRRANAIFFDEALSEMSQITIPARSDHQKQVFHLYCIRAADRDGLVSYLLSQGIDAKIHYPIPMHLQPAAKYLGYQPGDFPVSERLASQEVSLPVHEFITPGQKNFVVEKIRSYYS